MASQTFMGHTEVKFARPDLSNMLNSNLTRKPAMQAAFRHEYLIRNLPGSIQKFALRYNFADHAPIKSLLRRDGVSHVQKVSVSIGTKQLAPQRMSSIPGDDTRPIPMPLVEAGIGCSDHDTPAVRFQHAQRWGHSLR